MQREFGDSNLDLLKLLKLEKEIEQIITSGIGSDDKLSFYKAIKLVINLKLNVDEFNERFQEFEELFTSIAMGDFSKRMDIPNRKNLFTYMASSINAVIDEQEVNLIKKQYLETCIEKINEIALITNKKGTIQFANEKAATVFNRNKSDLLKLFVANLFESQLQFGIEIPDFKNFKDIPLRIIPYGKEKIEVLLTVEPILNRLEQIDGYLYTAKIK
jgi:signal transduction histidine kinase